MACADSQAGAGRRLASGGAGMSGGWRIVGLALVLVVALVALDAVVLAVARPTANGRHYYLALGNSITFGFQPDFNFTAGFVDNVFAKLEQSGVTDEVNYGCGGETTTTMIQGGCLGHLIHHNAYSGAQLDAAVSFLHEHPGRVSPITLEIGANDLLPDWNNATCDVGSTFQTDVQTMDNNITKVIMPRLLDALKYPGAQAASDIVMLNYYDPFIRDCPSSLSFVHAFNAHLAADAALFRIPVVDVFTAFGGDTGMAKNICQYTWICSVQFHDFHPTTAGYKVIAGAVEQTLNYPGTNAPPVALPMGAVSPGLGWGAPTRAPDPSEISDRQFIAARPRE